MTESNIPQLRRWATRDLAYVYRNGKKTYFGKWGSSESIQKYNDFIKKLADEESKPAITLRYVVDRFLEAKSNYYVKRGEQTRQLSRIKTACEYPVKMYGDRLVDSITPKTLIDCRAEMEKSGRFSRSYINTLISCFRLVIRWGVEQELVKAETLTALQAISPLKRGRSIAKETNPVSSVDPEIVEKTIKVSPPIIADMIRVQTLTGMRPTEVCQMREGDLDIKDNTVSIYTLSTDKTDYRRDPKNKRRIPLGKKAVNIIKRYLNGDPDNVIFAPYKSVRERNRTRQEARKTKTPPSQARRVKETDEALKERLNETYDTAAYGRAIARACVKAGVEKWSPNQLRHLFATHVREVYGLEAAQVCLGHSNANVTQIYAERDFQKAVEIATKEG